MNKIYEIFKQHRRQLSFIYLFMLIAELSNLATPFLLGKSIDGLMNGTWHWLVLLGVSYFLSAFFNYKRMVYDTKVYTRIYNSIVFRFLRQPHHDASTKIARTDMAHDIVNVLEGYVHYYIATIVTIVGSIGFIYSENWQVGVLVSIAFVMILAAVTLLYSKIKQAIKLRNTHYERKGDAIQAGYDTLKDRRDRFDIDNLWPDLIFEKSSYIPCSGPTKIEVSMLAATFSATCAIKKSVNDLGITSKAE